MPTNEKINLNYLHQTTYSNSATNQVGTDADFDSLYSGVTPLRTVPTPTGDIAYVRKFGLAHTITDLTALSDPGTVGLTWTVKTADGVTTYGSRANGGAYSDGSTTGTATAIRLEASVAGSTTTLPTTMSVTDSVVGALTINLPAESVTSVSPVIFYLARSGSSYYDSDLKYGGARHTPVLTSSTFPYFTIASAYGALAASNNDGVEILDSETYDEDLTADNQALDSADTIIYSKSGKSPTITRGIGARTSREVSTQYNNTTAIYFNENGNDSNDGTWQNPKLTIAGAIAARSTEDIVYGGTGVPSTQGEFNESVTIAAGYKIEADYGYTPTIIRQLTITHANGELYGFKLTDSVTDTAGIEINTTDHTGIILDCTISGFREAGIRQILSPAGVGTTIRSCIIENTTAGQGISYNNDATTAQSWLIEKNIIRNNVQNGISYAQGANNITVSGCEIKNNIIYGNTGSGIFMLSAEALGTIGITIENNTITQNTANGLRHEDPNGTLSITYKDNIAYNNTSNDLNASNGTPTITYSCYSTNSGFTIGAGNTTSDPKFCKITSPYKFGISSDSPCYRTDSSSVDMGAKLYNVEIDASDIIINGINFNGYNQYAVAVIIRDTINHTGVNIKWCNINNYTGIGVDLYDDGTDTDAIITNNLINNNGDGVKFSYGGNTFTNNIIYRNSVYGLHCNLTVNNISNNIFCFNSTGLYLESQSAGNTVKNNIFSQNSINGINSEANQVILNCCITDATNSNVDKTSSTNFTNNPLFINTTNGSENFNIKTVEGGYSYNSTCKGSSDDGGDVGAYVIDRSITNDYWKKHTFTYNPRVVEYSINSKGNTSFTAGIGTEFIWGKGRRRAFDLKWNTGQYADKTDRLKVEFINSLYSRADKLRTDEEIKVRFNPLPSQQVDSGTSATVSSTAKTITDSAKSLIEDELKGYHVGIKFASGSANGNLDASGTLTVGTASWTTNEWAGYTFPYNGYYYYIKSNTGTVLTLSDPDSTLSTVSGISWTIEKYFKILENSSTVLTVEDDDSELVSGSYDWIVRFMECHVLSPDMKYSQPRYFFQKDEWKTGFSMTLEEI